MAAPTESSEEEAMKRTTLFSVCSAFIALGVIGVAGYGCGDDDDNPSTPKPDAAVITPDAAKQDTSTPDTGPTKPAIPTLGAQIDRMGRPAVATALISAFEANAANKGTAKDNYNKDGTQTAWAGAYSGPVGGHLAIYDGLDVTAAPGDGCGNQLLAKDGGLASNANNATVYGGLAGALADDRLWLNTAGTTAAQYLAVEANATKVALNNDRGGRTLTYDVIDVTYSALAVGDVSGLVKDDIAADTAKTGGMAFPYLAAP
jgi:hypothetical protein